MCKIIKAEMVGTDFHIQSQCDATASKEFVFGIGKDGSVTDAVREFKLSHAASHRVRKPVVVEGLIGTEVE